jgi:hypothetical protein
LTYWYLHSFVFEAPWGWYLGTETCRSFWNLGTTCNSIMCIRRWMWLIVRIMHGIIKEFHVLQDREHTNQNH